jgi:hypothetical protein
MPQWGTLNDENVGRTMCNLRLPEPGSRARQPDLRRAGRTADDGTPIRLFVASSVDYFRSSRHARLGTLDDGNVGHVICPAGVISIYLVANQNPF